MNLKVQVYHILEEGDPKDFYAQLVNKSLITLILLNIFAIIFWSMPITNQYFLSALSVIDHVSIVVFSIEYFLRLWCCTENPKYAQHISGRIRYALSPMQVIDFLAIFPFYLPYLFPDMRFLRALRLFRLFRMAKIIRYTSAVHMFGNIIRRKREQLISAGTVFCLALLLFSCVMYHVENAVQPDVFSSIPASMWWCAITLTSTGYGDMVPITSLGKFIGALTAVTGICIYALPVGIIVTGFLDEFRKRKNKKVIRCPHCGNEIEKSETETAHTIF